MPEFVDAGEPVFRVDWNLVQRIMSEYILAMLPEIIGHDEKDKIEIHQLTNEIVEHLGQIYDAKPNPVPAAGLSLLSKLKWRRQESKRQQRKWIEIEEFLCPFLRGKLLAAAQPLGLEEDINWLSQGITDRIGTILERKSDSVA